MPAMLFGGELGDCQKTAYHLIIIDQTKKEIEKKLTKQEQAKSLAHRMA